MQFQALSENTDYQELLFILCLGGSQVLPGLHMIWLLLYCSLKEQDSIGEVAFCQALPPLFKSIRVISHGIIFFKLITLAGKRSRGLMPGDRLREKSTFYKTSHVLLHQKHSNYRVACTSTPLLAWSRTVTLLPVRSVLKNSSKPGLQQTWNKLQQ